MGKVIRVMLIVVVMVMGVTPTAVYGATPEQWGAYDIRTKPNEHMTAELLDKNMAEEGRGGVLIGMGAAILEAAEKNGLNAGITAGMLIVESGWGKGNRAMTTNNVGGIRCRADLPCKNNFAVFESVEHSIRIQAELLAGKTYIGAGATTFKQVMMIYAPPSDGNNLYGGGGYIAIVGGFMEKRFQQTIDSGEKLEGTGGNYTQGGNGAIKQESVGTWEKKNFFMQSDSVAQGLGVDNSQHTLPSETSYALKVFSEKTYKILVLIGVVLSAVFIAYMSTTVLFYVALVKGVAYRVDIYEKMVMSKEDEDIHSQKALWGLVGRMFVGVIIMSFFLTGKYVDVMGLIYLIVMDVLGYVV